MKWTMLSYYKAGISSFSGVCNIFLFIIICVKDKYKMADPKNSQFRIPPQMQQLGPAIENLDPVPQSQIKLTLD